jgi:DNA topoisomerase VI subunit B
MHTKSKMAPQEAASSHAKSKKRSLSSSKKESQESKSPAEFFAEHQAIAGFDNLGKSLYTTVRELVENALDACESIQQLPNVHIHIQEYNVDEFNRLQTSDIVLNGQEECSLLRKNATGGDRATVAVAPGPTVLVPSSPRSPSIVVVDEELFKAKSPKKRKRDKEEGEAGDKGPAEGVDDGAPNIKSTNHNNKKRQLTPNNKAASSMQYFLVTVSDNGCGMEHAAIPNLFGRVLSGRWTRHCAPGPVSFSIT